MRWLYASSVWHASLYVLALLVYDAVQIVVPEFTLNRYQYDRLQSNEAYRQAPTNLAGEKALQELRQAPEEEITKRRLSETDRILGSERHEGAQGLLRMLIIMLVDGVAFYVHWRVARAARSAASQETLAK